MATSGHRYILPVCLTLAARSLLAKSKTLNRRPFGDFPIFIGTFANRDFARLSCMIVLKFDVRLLMRENELFIILIDHENVVLNQGKSWNSAYSWVMNHCKLYAQN